MTTNTAGRVNRQDPRQVTNTLKATIAFNTTGANAGIAFGGASSGGGYYIPQNAVITNVMVEVTTAFNGGTNAITVGTNATSYNNMVQSGDLNPTLARVTVVDRGWGQSLTTAGDVLPFVTYTQTGAAATQGSATVTIEYEGGFLS